MKDISSSLRIVCLLILGLTIVPVIFFDISIDVLHPYMGPSVNHPLGTDGLGRDLGLIFCQIIWKSLIPIWSLAALCFCGGILSASALQNYGFEIILSIIVMAVAIYLSTPISALALLLSDITELKGFLILLTLFSFYGFASGLVKTSRLISIDRKRNYWLWSTTCGASSFQSIFRHGFKGYWVPEYSSNLGTVLKTILCMEIGLSYLGIGFQEPYFSIGNLISSNISRIILGDLWFMTVISAFLVFLYFCLGVKTPSE